MQGEHVVVAVLGFWGVVIYGASTYIKGKKAREQVADAPPAKPEE